MKHFCIGNVIALSMLMAGPAAAEEISVIVGGTQQGEIAEQVFIKPFEEATGIKVNALKIQPGAAKLRLQMESGTVDFDAALFLEHSGHEMYADGLLSDIDYSIYSPEELAGFDPVSRPKWGMESYQVAFVMAYNTDFYKDGKAPPQNWAEFWDVEKFPGRRMLMSGQSGVQGPFEEALLADGVPADKLYPLDIERAFKSLDKIKPHVRKWWSANEVEQYLGSNSVDVTMSYDTVTNTMRKAGKPVGINYNGAKIYGLYWAIPKASKNQAAVQKFVEFATRAKQQAAYATRRSASPANTGAFKYIDEETASRLISNPKNRANAYRIDQIWYGTKDADGKTNGDKLRERWNSWVAQ